MSLTTMTATVHNGLRGAIETGEENARRMLSVRQDRYVWLIVIAIAVIIALGLATAWFVYCQAQGGWPAMDQPSWVNGGTWKAYCRK